MSSGVGDGAGLGSAAYGGEMEGELPGARADGDAAAGLNAGAAGHVKGTASRYLLENLPEELTQKDLEDYFSVFGEVEEATLRTLDGASGKRISGSVKFAHPTLELRKMMLNERHEIRGFPIAVITWKMQKLNRPGYKAPSKGAAKGVSPLLLAHAGKGYGNNITTFVNPQVGGLLGGKGYGAVRAERYGPPGLVHAQPYGAMRAERYGPPGLVHADPYGPPALIKGGKAWGVLPAVGGGGCFGPKGGKGPMLSAFAMGPGAFAQRPGGAKGGGKTVAEAGVMKEMTSRFVLTELTPEITETDVRDYFGQFGDLEEVVVKLLESGKISGSVKFAAPTAELRHTMLNVPHSIRDTPVKVMTHKMQKMEKPGFRAKLQAERQAARGGPYGKG